MATATKRVKEKEKKPVKDRVEKFTQNLKCTLAPSEIAQRADRAANLVAMITEKDEERKAANKHAQGEIDQLTAELTQLSGEVRARATYRQVECERRFVFADGEVRETRLDTFDVLNSRKMTERELQPDLEFPEGANGKPSDAPPDDLWRPIPIGEALKGLPKKVYESFENAGINSMGDFADFQGRKGEFWVKDLDGVGPGMAEKISDAAIAFWAEIGSKHKANAIESNEATPNEDAD